MSKNLRKKNEVNDLVFSRCPSPVGEAALGRLGLRRVGDGEEQKTLFFVSNGLGT